MRTPDKIKKGLECCSNVNFVCNEECPYYKSLSEGEDCCLKKNADALALIQQLQAENAEQAERIQQLGAELSDAKNNHQHTIDIAERQKDQIDKLKKVIVRLNAERDAAVAGLKSNCVCPECKYFSDDIQEPCRGCKPNDSKFEWRGVQKD